MHHQIGEFAARSKSSTAAMMRLIALILLKHIRGSIVLQVFASLSRDDPSQVGALDLRD